MSKLGDTQFEVQENGYEDEPPPIVDDPEGSWTARCTACDGLFDLESLGWKRVGAASWGKRMLMNCPTCECGRMMAIVHLDRYGRPDQPFAYVLRRVLGIQVIVFGVVGTIAVAVLLVLQRYLL